MSDAIHPGSVVHVWDHFVLDLTNESGGSAYLSLYAISLSPSVGAGTVALLAYGTRDNRHDMLLGDDVAAARRMRERLRSMDYSRSSLDLEPAPARFHRSADPHRLVWRIESDAHTVVATWSDLRAPFQISAPAPRLLAGEDISAVFVEAGHASLEVDGDRVEAKAQPDEYWRSKVGRPLLACHAALAEVRIRVVTRPQ